MLWPVLCLLCGALYIGLRFAGVDHSDVFILGAGAFVFGIASLMSLTDDSEST